MKRLILALALLAWPLFAHAQQAITVTTCGTFSYDVGRPQPLLSNTAGGLCIADIAGTVPAGGTDAGNPIKVGGVYTTAAPTLTNNQRGNLRMAADASIYTVLSNGAGGSIIPAYPAGDAIGTNYAYPITSFGTITDGTNWDRIREIVNATNSTGTGIQAVGNLAQLDDTSPTAITENQFGNVRMGALRQLLVQQLSVYPYSAVNGAQFTPVTASSGNVANAAATATLTSAASKTMYITGFQCTPGGSTAAALVNTTVTGVITGTMTYTMGTPAGVTIMGTPLVVTFNPAVPASATNTNIVVSMPALGAGNTNAACSAQGYLGFLFFDNDNAPLFYPDAVAYG